MKIGIVDLDTSHPQNWIPIERELGHEIVGVWDGGSVHPKAYVEKFAEEHKLPRVFSSLEELAAVADCAIIHGCDWDTHLDKAIPFVEAGKGVLLDKPLAGKVRDIQRLQAWASEGVRITGGSSLRFCQETTQWLAQPVSERGAPHTILAGCAVDEFNYGIHAYSLLCGLMGPGAERVRHLGKDVQRRIQVTWEDGRTGFLVVGPAPNYMPFYATIVTEKGVTHFQADSSRLYRALLTATLPYLAGETDTPPAPMEALVEPELIALAARFSWLNDDREVRLDELPASDPGYDGEEFAAGYRKAKYP